MKKPVRKKPQASGGVSIRGNVNTGGGDITGGDHIEIHSGGPSAASIAAAFAPIYARIDALASLPPVERADLKAAAGEIQAEAGKGKKADEAVLLRRLREVGRMAPDILEVILATLANPLVGLALVAQKVAKKAGDGAGTGAGTASK